MKKRNYRFHEYDTFMEKTRKCIFININGKNTEFNNGKNTEFNNGKNRD